MIWMQFVFKLVLVIVFQCMIFTGELLLNYYAMKHSTIFVLAIEKKTFETQSDEAAL